MGNQTCKDCQKYHQHYGLDGERIYKIHCGHCNAVRLRKRAPDSKICEHFVQRQDSEEYVTKSYLTKALLDYILKMDLLPEILELARE